MIFLDTSAIYAMADKSDVHHAKAVSISRKIEHEGGEFLLTSYIISEAAALLQKRGSRTVAEHFLADTESFDIEWIDEDIHRDAVSLFTGLEVEGVSLVDCASFVVMKRRGIKTAFSFDRHFVRQGFSLAGD